MDFKMPLPAITGWRTYWMWLVSVLVIALLSGWYFGELPAWPNLATPFESYVTTGEVAAGTATVRADLKAQAEVIRTLEARLERTEALRDALEARLDKVEAWQGKASAITTGSTSSKPRR